MHERLEGIPGSAAADIAEQVLVQNCMGRTSVCQSPLAFRSNPLWFLVQWISSLFPRGDGGGERGRPGHQITKSVFLSWRGHEVLPEDDKALPRLAARVAKRGTFLKPVYLRKQDCGCG